MVCLQKLTEKPPEKLGSSIFKENYERNAEVEIALNYRSLWSAGTQSHDFGSPLSSREKLFGFVFSAASYCAT